MSHDHHHHEPADAGSKALNEALNASFRLPQDVMALPGAAMPREKMLAPWSDRGRFACGRPVSRSAYMRRLTYFCTHSRMPA